MFKIKGVLLEVSSGEFEGNKYASAKVRSADVAENKILKYKVDLKKVSVEALNELLDNEVVLTCDLSKGANDSAVLKIVDVE